MKKKHYTNIAFHNFNIKCTQNQTPVVSGVLQSKIIKNGYFKL